MKRRFICPICSCPDLAEAASPDDPRHCTGCGYETRSDNEYEEAEKKYRRPESPMFGFSTGHRVRLLDTDPGPVFDSWHDDDDDDDDPGFADDSPEYEKLKKKVAFLGGHATIRVDDVEMKLSSFKLDVPPKRTPFHQRARGGYEMSTPFRVVRVGRSYNIAPDVEPVEARRRLVEELRDELHRATEAFHFPCLGPDPEA